MPVQTNSMAVARHLLEEPNYIPRALFAAFQSQQRLPN